MELEFGIKHILVILEVNQQDWVALAHTVFIDKGDGAMSAE